ncbi:MAG: SWIM zinc finger family protein [Candidatus Acidiferrales bacterium]
MSKALTDLVNEATLEELAGERAFERGADYFADGQVVGLKEENGTITARVRGTYYYRVKLWAEDEELASECNCPVGQDGVFCKHCVAAGLTWLDRRKQTGGVTRRQTKRDMSDEEIRAYLMGQDKTALIELLMGHADWDSDLRDRLALMTAEKGGKQPDLAAFRAAIDKAIRHRSFMDYGRMPEYARGIEAVVDSLDNLLKRGHGEVRELTERALKQMESAMDHVDDSDGFMGGILERLQELHLSACRAAKPDPSALAKFLFEWEASSDWEIFLGAAEKYADILGKAGLAQYRKLTEGKWANVPALAPGEKDPERYGGRWRITYIMETLARQEGDIEGLVAVKSRDLSEAISFLEIAQIYKAAGNDDAALEWAERGARAFPANTDGRLRKFLIDEYQRRKRHDEAIAIAWTSFREHPGLDSYQGLNHSAFCAKQWPEWREKALALLREEIAAQRKQIPKNGWGPPTRADHSELVEIYLWEGDVETAWNEAKNGGCHDALWFRLAEAREKDHPEDAIAVYTKQLKLTLQYAQQSAYEEAVEILGKIRKLMVRIGKEPEFVSLVKSIRAQYKPRRNFMKLLDAERR